MPFRDPDDFLTVGPVARLPEELPPETESPSFGEAFNASFRQENSIGSWWTHRLGLDEDVDPTYDPFAEIEGTPYADYADAFALADTSEEVQRVKSRIDLELQDRETLHASGLMGVVAGLAAGVLDPINLVPIGGAVVKGGSVLAAGARTAMAGFLGMSASEAALNSQQVTRTLGESAENIAAGTLLAGILGTGIGAYSARQVRKLTGMIEQDMNLKAMANASAFDPDKFTVTEEDIFGKAVIEPDLSGIRAQGESEAPIIRDPAEGEDLPPPSGGFHEKMSSAWGVEHVSSALHLAPSIRIMASANSNEAKTALLDLVEFPAELVKNTKGIGTQASVESLIKMRRSMDAAVVRQAESEYRNYRLRVAGKSELEPGIRDYRNRMSNLGSQVRDFLPGAPKRLSEKEFYEKAGKAATMGDTWRVGPAHPEIEKLAKFIRKNVYEPIQKEAESVGLMPEGLKVETAISYLTRVYKSEMLRQDPDNAFQKLAASWAQDRHPEMSTAEAMRAGAEIRQTLLGTPGGRVPYEALEVGNASPIKERVFTVADSELHRIGVLDTNILTVTRMYLKTMGADIELMKRFGTVRFDESEPFKKIVAEYAELAEKATGKQRSNLHRERDEVLRKIAAMWDMLRGTPPAGRSMPPDALSKRIGIGVRQITALGMGGRFAINSLTDFGRIVMGQGLYRTMKAPIQMLMSGLDTIKLNIREQEMAGVGFETLLDTRMDSMADIGDEMRPTTKFERGLHAATTNFFLINGLSPLTTMEKQFGGLIVHQRILQQVEKIVAGKASAANVRDLGAYGIGLKEAKKIAAQAHHWDRSRKLWTSHTDRWDDGGAVQAFRVALQRATDRMVTTPGVGDRPIPLVSTEMGKLIGQFRGFNFAAANSSLIPLLQKARHGDAAALSGLTAQVFLGMLVYWVNAVQRDKELSTDARTWIAEGIDRSGALGFYADINNMAEVMSRGTIGINAMAGGPVLSRYAGRNYLGAVLGPQVSRMEDIARITGALSPTGEGLTEADTRSMRRMMPYQNVWYLERLFDLVEQSTNESLGVNMKRSRTQ